jgi:hypothetical protein
LSPLADNGGYVLAEDGSRLLFFRRRILPSWMAFVSGLLAVIALGNGVVQLVLGNLAAGGALLVAGAGAALTLLAVLRSRRRATATPLEATTALVVIDLEARSLLDGGDRILAPLDAVRVERSMQMTSSARALRIVWPGGAMVVYRGDALLPGGSIAVAIEVLRTRGVPISG